MMPPESLRNSGTSTTLLARECPNTPSIIVVSGLFCVLKGVAGAFARERFSETDSVVLGVEGPDLWVGALWEPQSARRPLGRDQISEKVSSPSSSKRLA